MNIARKTLLVTMILAGTTVSGVVNASIANAAPVHFQVAQNFVSPVHDRGSIQFQANATSANVDGYVAHSTDRYTFTASAGQAASLNVYSPNQEVRLTVLDPDGNALTGQTSSWAGNLPMDGTYTVNVMDIGGASTYNLGLDIEPASSSQVHNRGEIHFQPNATSASVTSQLAANNIDHYTFEASAGQPASIYLSSPDGDVALTLIDPNGNPILRSQAGLSDWSGTLPVSGTYTLNAVSIGSATTYNLSLNINPN
jgi:hypothetical protein